MFAYTVTMDERSAVPNRDAYAVTLRVTRNGQDLGLWQTWISGPSDAAIDRHGGITRAQRRWIAADLLADAIEAAARAGTLRTEWHEEIEALEPTTYEDIIRYADGRPRPVPDFRPGVVLREFDV